MRPTKTGTSVVGLAKPLFPLKVPAIVCISARLLGGVHFLAAVPEQARTRRL
ncbi:MAG: hypothetical protein MZV65_47505 [Chromatiales bacterium]|nr:hypothetical protein [Chromatiales bacterium]